MSRRARIVLVVLGVIILGALVAADVIVRNIAIPTYLGDCRPTETSLVMDGFDDPSPVVRRMCVDGRRLAPDASLDLDSGELRITSSDAGLQLLDGTRSRDADIRIFASGIDHSKDAFHLRLLELATPFSDLDPTSPAAQGDFEPIVYEVGRPRVEQASGSYVLTMRLGAAATDESTSLSVHVRPPTSA